MTHHWIESAEATSPQRQPRQTPAARSWPWVARGLTLKLAALCIGLAALIPAAFALYLTPDARLALITVTAVVGGAALLLDWVGRLHCLATPPQVGQAVKLRWSVAFQTGAIVGVALTFLGGEVRLIGALLAPVFQFASATLFVGYLRALADHFRRDNLQSYSRITLVLLKTLAVAFSCLLLFALVVAAIALAVTFAYPSPYNPFGYLVAGLGLLALLPLAAVLGVLVVLIYTFYGIVLFCLRITIHARLRRPFAHS